MDQKKILLYFIILITVIISSVPLIIGYIVQPPDRHFLGIVSGVHDWAQYMAWMKAHTVDIIITNKLTPEVQSPAFFNLQWFILGRLASLLNLSQVTITQLFRIIVSITFLIITFKFCESYFDEPWMVWMAWIFINFSAGLGWICVIFKHFFGITITNPIDIYIVEPISFQNMIGFPHFLLAVIMMLLVYLLVIRSLREKNILYCIFAGLVGLLLGLTHAYDLLIVFSVLGVFILLVILKDGFSWYPIIIVAIVFTISFPPAAYFLYLTSTNSIWMDVLEQFKNAMVFTPNPLGLLVLIGVPLIVAILTYDGLFPLHNKNYYEIFISVWFIVNFFLLYVPTDFQVHMLSGWQIPIGILASDGIFNRLIPELTNHNWFRNFSNKFHQRLGSRYGNWIVLAIFTLSVLPGNLYLLIWRVREVIRIDDEHFLYKDEFEALRWLDENTLDSDKVFSGLKIGMHVPGITGNNVYLGHWAQTVEFYKKQEQVENFFQEQTSDAYRLKILSDYDINFLYYGREEKRLGNYNPSKTPNFVLVYYSPEVQIYKVTKLDNHIRPNN